MGGSEKFFGGGRNPAAADAQVKGVLGPVKAEDPPVPDELRPGRGIS